MKAGECRDTWLLKILSLSDDVALNLKQDVHTTFLGTGNNVEEGVVRESTLFRDVSLGSGVVGADTLGRVKDR